MVWQANQLDEVYSTKEERGYALTWHHDRTDFSIREVTIEKIKGSAHTSHSFDITIIREKGDSYSLRDEFFSKYEDAMHRGIELLTNRRNEIVTELTKIEQSLATKWIYEA